MNNKEEKEVILEQYQEFPAGRGKKAFFGTSSTVEPKKRQKRNPKRFCLFRVKSNPSSIELVIYKPRLKNIIIYPNKKRLTYEEETKLIASLLIHYLYTYRGQIPMKLLQNCNNLIRLPKDLTLETVQQHGRLQKWIKRKSK